MPFYYLLLSPICYMINSGVGIFNVGIFGRFWCSWICIVSRSLAFLMQSDQLMFIRFIGFRIDLFVESYLLTYVAHFCGFYDVQDS